MRFFTAIFLIFFITTGCSIGKSSQSPYRKYSPAQLQDDYSLYRHILETHHPSLYWYMPKDSMNYYFEQGKNQLTDSLTGAGFRKVLNYVTAKISCGHTTVRAPKTKHFVRDTVAAQHLFPISVKVWEDTMVITSNINRKDSLLTRGTVITRFDGRTIPQLMDTLFEYISTDGYNLTHKYQSLSNRGYFGALYTSVFGLKDSYQVDYIDRDAQLSTATLNTYNPTKDTAIRRRIVPVGNIPKPSKKERKRMVVENVRLLKIDSVNKTAMMDLSSFGKGFGLRTFFRHSFKALDKNKIGHLIIDVRGNGGGSVTYSTLATKYIATQSFKIADTLFAIRKHSKYSRYIQNSFWNNLFINFFTRRDKRDGYYHFRYFERHYFKPKKQNHFDGKVYILTGGNSFSATTLFTEALIAQDNVTVVGEETGGGAYGNSAWLIPDVTLPITKTRFRLPLFRLVINKKVPKNGRGVQPEVLVLPTVEDIRKNVDYKTVKAMELIEKDKASRE